MCRLQSLQSGEEGGISCLLCGPWVTPRTFLGERCWRGLPSVWDTEGSDVVVQRPGEICAAKLAMSKRHRAAEGGSIQPWITAFWRRNLLPAALPRHKGAKWRAPVTLRGQCLAYHPQSLVATTRGQAVGAPCTPQSRGAPCPGQTALAHGASRLRPRLWRPSAHDILSPCFYLDLARRKFSRMKTQLALPEHWCASASSGGLGWRQAGGRDLQLGAE